MQHDVFTLPVIHAPLVCNPFAAKHSFPASFNQTIGFSRIRGERAVLALSMPGEPRGSDHPLGHHVAGEQRHAEDEHEQRGGRLDAAHREDAAAGAMSRDPPRHALRAHCEGRNRGNRDGGAEPHYEGGRDADPEQSLRQRKDKNENCAGARPETHRDDRR